MSDLRLQFRRGVSLLENENPVEGEPFWDPNLRRVGFWNPEYLQIDWFRIPGPGEGVDYIPRHEIDTENHRIRWMQHNGVWGDWVSAIPPEITLTAGTITEGEVFDAEIVPDEEDENNLKLNLTLKPGPPINLTIGNVVEGPEFDAQVIGEGTEYQLHLQLKAAQDGEDGDDGVIPVVDVAMINAGLDPALVNTGTPEAPAYRLDIPYSVTPVDASVMVSKTDGTNIENGEYFATRYMHQAATIRSIYGEVLLGYGVASVALVVNGIVVSDVINISPNFGSVPLPLNIPVAKGDAVSFMVYSANNVKSLWLQVTDVAP